MFLLILEQLQSFQGLLILLWHEIKDCHYGSKVILFGYFNLHKKPLFDNRKYNWGTLPRVRESFLNLAIYQKIGDWGEASLLYQ